jgi:hypothetical protein
VYLFRNIIYVVKEVRIMRRNLKIVSSAESPTDDEKFSLPLLAILLFVGA